MIPVLWFLAIFGSQFYVFSSGTPQPSHLLIPLIIILYSWRFRLNVNLSQHDWKVVKFLLAMMFYVIIANLVWALVEQNEVFVSRSTVFWIFGGLIFIYMLASLEQLPRLDFFIMAACVAGGVVLFLAWMLGVGRYDYFPRYNGFFNDPNQMAFWVICIFCTFFFMSQGRFRHWTFLFAILCLTLVFATQSRSALLGVFFCVLAAGARVIGVGEGRTWLPERAIGIGVSMLLMMALVYYFLGFEVSQAVFARFAETDFEQQAEVRGYYRLFDYPRYLLLGTGQGLDWRFGGSDEIHSTWVGILFYYGLLGLTIFLLFLFSIFRRLDVAEKVVFMAPVFYGFSTYGARTPVFWMFLAAAAYAASRHAMLVDQEAS